MPYRGKPSKNCGPCRKRKIKCDLKVPGCTQCSNAGLECPGYRNQLDLMFLDENERTERSVLKRGASRKEPLKTPASTASSRRPSPARAVTTNSIPKELAASNQLRPGCNGLPLATRASHRRKARTATPEEAERMEVSRRRALSQADLDRRPMMNFDFGVGLNFVDAFGNLTTQPQSNLKLETHDNYQMIDPSITTRIDPFLLPTQTYNPSTSHAHTQSILIPQPIYDTLPYDFNISLSDSINFNLINPTPLTPTNYAAQQHFQSMSQQLHQSQQQHQMQQQLHSNSVSPQMLQQTTMSRQPSMQSSETSTRVFDQQWEWTQTAPTSSAASITSYPNAGAEMQGGGQGQMQNAQMRQMIDWREWSHEYELPFDDPGAGR